MDAEEPPDTVSQKAIEPRQSSGLANVLGCLPFLLISSIPSLMILWAGFPIWSAIVAWLLSALVYGILIFSLGNDSHDIMVGSVIFLLLCLLIIPMLHTPERRSENRIHQMTQQLLEKQEDRDARTKRTFKQQRRENSNSHP